MITFRWIILRLFWSLLALIPAAFFTLWLAHEYLLPQSNLFDEAIVAVLALALFALAGHVLTREGQRRFDFLHAHGKALLQANRDGEMHDVFALLLQLQRSGLLSERVQQGMQRRLLRSYFPFYADHPERPDFQEQLLLALREGVRAEEAYHVLKAHVLDQKALTLETANLAEELLDYKPEDEALSGFFAEYFLREKKTHYRAEYFYARHLSQDGPLTGEILALCLPRALQPRRRDDFAGWCLVRAFERQTEPADRVRQALWALHQAFQKSRRRDALAREVAALAGQIPPAERATAFAPEKKMGQENVRQAAARWRFRLQQILWEGWSPLRPYKREIALALMILFLFGVLYWSRPFSSSPPQVAEAPAAPPDTANYYSLQVIALKDKRSAEAAADLLQRRQLEVYVLEPRSARGWYRVRVGKYPSARRARLAADSLKAAGLIDDYFVTNYERR